MKTSTRNRRLVLAIAVVLAIAAPSALAQRPATCAELAQLVYSPPVGSVNVAGPATPCPVLEQIVYGSSGLATPDWQLRYGADGSGVEAAPSPVEPSIPRATTSVAAAGLNWGDAGIGAGIALGAVLIAGGAALGIVRRLAVVSPR